jgi:glycerol-1-phosphate dehydrogenase [NAD(P)+]
MTAQADPTHPSPSIMETPTSILEQAVGRASVTKAVAVESGALSRLPAMLAALGYAGACRIVADDATMEAAGHRTLAVLRDAGVRCAEPIVLHEAPRLKPHARVARELGEQLKAGDALPVAVGSGVINDLTKYAAALAQRPYACVATAASMDGYAASGAALLDDGFKRTLDCAPPIAIIADLDVLANAPARMTAWGYGDLAGKVVAGADWILADALGEDRLAPLPFALVQDNIKGWLRASDRIESRDIDALRGLISGLLVAGFAMQAHGNSRPASGSDHQIAHVWEMERLMVAGEPAAHGACVGVGTVAMLALYEWFLRQDVAAAVADAMHADGPDAQRVEAEVRASFAEPSLVDSAMAEVRSKLARASHRPARLAALGAAWPGLRARLESTLVPAATMAQWLAACGGASHPADLGVSLGKLAADYRRARLIRRRYTLLDCLEDLGLLDAAIAALFADGGFWQRRSR